MTRAQTIGYGIGDFGFNLFFTGLNLYLLFYYTDVLGIPAATAGLIFGISVLWDAVTDPVMGWIATRAHKYMGGFRPFILLGAPIMSLSFIGMFAAPLWFESALVIACAVSHLMFRTAYTLVSIPYSALSSVITFDSRERGQLASARMVFAILGGLTTAALTLPLAGALGDGDLKLGFLRLSIVFAALAFFLMMIVYWKTEERAESFTTPRTASLTTSLHMLKKNTAFWILFAAIFTLSMGTSIASKALVYYVTYVIRAPDSVSTILAAGLLAAALSVPIWAILAKKYDKKWIWIAGLSFHITAMSTLFITAPETVNGLLPLHVLTGLGYGAVAVMLWSMLPDTVEWGQVYGDVRDEGLLFGLNQLSLKAASALAVSLLGLALGLIGYEPHVAQSAQTLAGLRWLAFGAPILGGVISVIVIAFYPISHKRHLELRQQIKEAAL